MNREKRIAFAESLTYIYMNTTKVYMKEHLDCIDYFKKTGLSKDVYCANFFARFVDSSSDEKIVIDIDTRPWYMKLLNIEE